MTDQQITLLGQAFAAATMRAAVAALPSHVTPGRITAEQLCTLTEACRREAKAAIADYLADGQALAEAHCWGWLQTAAQTHCASAGIRAAKEIDWTRK